MSNLESSVSPNIQIISEEKPEHHCGIGLKYVFGSDLSTANHQEVGEMGYALQHRGQHGAGSSWSDELSTSRAVMDGLINPSFISQINHTPKRWQMIHTRYGTTGGYKDYNIQPCITVLPDGEELHMAVNGNIPNSNRLRRYLPDDINRQLPSDVSDTVLATNVLGTLAQDFESFDEAIYNFAHLEEIEQSATNAIIGKGNVAYGLREEHGIHPLYMAQKDNGFYIASETVAFDRINIHNAEEFPAGSIVKLTKDGAQWLDNTNNPDRHECAYEWFYFSHPNSRMKLRADSDEETVLMDFRMETGKTLAQESPVPDADMVIGMPDSGLHAAYGYAQESKVPYYPGITRNHYGEDGSQRSFLRDDTNMTNIVIGKLMLAPSKQYRDKKIVMVDDSIVRGSNSGTITKILFEMGAKEVHWRAASPPTIDTCHLGVSIRQQSELIYYRHNGDLQKIAEEIGATSVGYLSQEGFIRAGRGKINIPDNKQHIFLKNQLCGGCMTGVHPIDSHGKPFAIEGTIFKSSKQSIPIPLLPVA